MTRKPARSKKSSKERKRLEKQSTARIVGEGFVRRVRKPKQQGKKVKSVMLRVDAGFAEWCRRQAEKDGGVTKVTRRLHEQIRAAEAIGASNA